MSEIPFSVSAIAAVSAILLTGLSHLLYKLYTLNKNLIFLFFTLIFFATTAGCSFLALKNLSIAQFYLLTAFVPILTVIFGWGFLKEKVSRHHLIGLALTLSGAIIFFTF